jgi:hypothetical protein
MLNSVESDRFVARSTNLPAATAIGRNPMVRALQISVKRKRRNDLAKLSLAPAPLLQTGT